MSSNSISYRRLFNLTRYEFSVHRVFYVKSIAGLFLLVLCLFLLSFYNRISNFSTMYYAELILVIILGIGYSFVELRNKESAQVYLSLPGSAIEKYLVQFFTRVVAFPILFTILFVLAISLAKALFHLSSTTTFFYGDTTQVINDLDIRNMILVFLSWNKPAITYFFIFGLLGLLTSLMFAGGIFFGKWNSVAMPAVLGVIILFMIGNYFLLSWLVDASPFGLGGNYGIRVDSPEVITGISIFHVVSVLLIWSAAFLTFLVTYFKLKEREV